MGKVHAFWEVLKSLPMKETALDSEDLGREVAITFSVSVEKTLTLDVGDMAKILGKKPETILRMAERGDIPAISKAAQQRLNSIPDNFDLIEVHSDEFETQEFNEV